MKSESALLLLTGIAIGAIAALLLFAPQKGLKSSKDVLKKSKKYKKAFKETASRYKEKLAGLKDDIQEATHDAKKEISIIVLMKKIWLPAEQFLLSV